MSFVFLELCTSVKLTLKSTRNFILKKRLIQVQDGQFLVRQKPNQEKYGLSFRFERAPGVVEVKHALINYNREMCTFRFGDVDFAQLRKGSLLKDLS